MIKCAITLLTIATCIVGIFADDFCEKQRKLDSECAKYCYQVAKPLLQMAPVCHQKDAEITQLNSKIAKLVVFEEREKNCLTEVKLCNDLNEQLAKEEEKYNELHNQFIELNKKLAVYADQERKNLEKKIADMQEQEKKCLEKENTYNELHNQFNELNKKLDDYKEREKKSLEEGTKCNELNEKLDKQLRILLNLEEREKKDIEEINLNKQLNVQLGEVQQKLGDCEERENKCIKEINLNKKVNIQLGDVQNKLADCEEREKKSKENNSKAESRLQTSLEEYRKKLSDLESSNLALSMSNQEVKENLKQRYYYKWVYKNTCLTQRPGVDTTGTVEIEGMEAFSVRCVNDLNSGPGWMLIQKRIEPLRSMFFSDWSRYRDGFGDINDHFFIGLEKLYRLTNVVPHELYIDMEEWGGKRKFAHYDNFRVGSESEQYPLEDLGNYTPDSNAGDALRDNNNMKFSTWDRDNDNSPDDCVHEYDSGWWHNDCTKANLNGLQLGRNVYEKYGIWWHSHVGLKNVRMLIRPKVKK